MWCKVPEDPTGRHVGERFDRKTDLILNHITTEIVITVHINVGHFANQCGDIFTNEF